MIGSHPRSNSTKNYINIFGAFKLVINRHTHVHRSRSSCEMVGSDGSVDEFPPNCKSTKPINSVKDCSTSCRLVQHCENHDVYSIITTPTELNANYEHNISSYISYPDTFVFFICYFVIYLLFLTSNQHNSSLYRNHI